MSLRQRRVRAIGRGAATLVAGALAVYGLVALPATAAHADTAPPAGVPQTVSADGLPTAQVDGIVWKTQTVGTTVYAVGSFSHARPAGTSPGDPAEVPRA